MTSASSTTGGSPDPRLRARRSDARRNEKALLDAAAAVFVTDGVTAPVRRIAERAGVGLGTIYRHFPTRAALVTAVYMHQVCTLAEAGPRLLREEADPGVALHRWVRGFVDFLVTKHGLAEALGDDAGEAGALHRHFLETLVPVCDDLLAATSRAGGAPPLGGYALMRGVGNLCIGAGTDPDYDAAELARMLVAGVLASAR